MILLLLTRSAPGVFGSVSSSGKPRGFARATATRLTQRREGLETGTNPGGRFRRSRNLHTRIFGWRGQRSPSSRVIISDKSQEMHKAVFSQLFGKHLFIYTD
jgi:hypothetical protein